MAAHAPLHELLQFVQVLLIDSAGRAVVLLAEGGAMPTISPMQPQVRITRTGPRASWVTLMSRPWH